jgi:FtsP/CotA-like multicopper oxidase with cupredoxin domain
MFFPAVSSLNSRFAAAGALALLACTAHATPAESADFDAASTTAHPCGTGVPAPGHFLPEVRPTGGGIAMSVRQDGSHLCYVVNGNADAPVIRVRRGSELVITLRNEITDPAAIDAVTGPGTLRIANGEVPHTPGFYEVEAGMKHRATGTTNLHVHGFAVPPTAPQDDVLTICTDPADGTTRCGRRSFTYRYRIPANMPEGLYWYHPHVHGEVQAQMLMGLSGAIVVEGPLDDSRRRQGIKERVLIVRQTQDNDAGKTQAAAMTAAAPLPEAVDDKRAAGAGSPANQIDTAHELLCSASSGIDQISVNGTPVPVADAPDAALGRIEVAGTTPLLLRIVNAATDAFLDLNLVDEKGAALPLTVVARDGAPLADDAGVLQPQRATPEAQFVPPSGRIELLVRAPADGGKAYLVTHAVDTGCAGDRLPERKLALIVPAGGKGIGVATSVSEVRSGPAKPGVAQSGIFSGLMARTPGHVRTWAFAEYPRPGTDDQTDFYLFERKPGAVLRPYEMGDPPALTVDAGTTEEWTIENWTNELHAFHMHQVHFRVLEVDGKPVENPPLLDVVSVPYATATGFHSTEGPVRPGRVRIRVEFPPELAGDIPVHCHLVDHEDNGMMAVIRVRPALSAGQTTPRRN